MFSYLYVVLIFTQTILARVGVFTCVSRNDCDDGYACHKGICIKCFNCNLLLRKGSDCVVDFNECGECLIGFTKVLITDSSNAIKPCKPIRLKEKLNESICANDSICPPDYYCHEQSCVKCFNCSVMNRVSSVGNCPKLLSDCGSCMNGFEEVAVTVNTDIKLCERQIITVESEISSIISLNSIGSICMLILVIILAIAAKCIKRPKVKVLTKSQCPKLPSAPPLYTMDMPLHIKKLEEQKSDVALTVEHIQQAKIFKQPDALYYFREDEMQGSDPDSENGVQGSRPNLWAPTTSTEPDTEVIFVNDYDGQNADISVTDSAQHPEEVGGNTTSVSELDENQLRDFSVEDIVNSTNSNQGKNPSN